MNDLMKRLKEAGSIGLDMSPGDPLCMEALVEIEKMEKALQLVYDLLENQKGPVAASLRSICAEGLSLTQIRDPHEKP